MSDGGREAVAQTGTIETRIPARLDRLPWAKFHRMIIGRALVEHGSAGRRELNRRVGGRCWGPGRFRSALREAEVEGRVKRLRSDQYAPVNR